MLKDVAKKHFKSENEGNKKYNRRTEERHETKIRRKICKKNIKTIITEVQDQALTTK